MDNNKNTFDKLKDKWKPLVEGSQNHEKIGSDYKKTVTSVLLENQAKSLKEDAPTNNTSNVQNWNPVMMSLVRRMAPKLMAFDIAGVQPMTGPTGLIFAIRANNDSGDEILFNEADSGYSGNDTDASQTDPNLLADSDSDTRIPDDGFDTDGTKNDLSAITGYKVGQAVSTASMEAFGGGAGGDGTFNSVSFQIDKQTVTAKSRALKAEYTTELAQDLQAIHGQDAEAELANILSNEIMAEINREMVRTIYISAKAGAQEDTSQAGLIDASIDTNGRWAVERFKGLLYNIERDANKIAIQTRRGKGNFVITSSDVASALAAADVLDYTPALQTGQLEVDDTGSTFAGVINNNMKVYIDPYFSSDSSNFYCVGYKGESAYDAGIFYCPYVPLQLMRAVGEDSFQPKIGFKTRYGMAINPFVNTPSAGDISNTIYAGINPYYRIVKVTNLM